MACTHQCLHPCQAALLGSPLNPLPKALVSPPGCVSPDCMTAVPLLPGEDAADEKFKETEFQEGRGMSLWSQGQNPQRDLFYKLARAPWHRQEPWDLLRSRKAHRYLGRCWASNGHQYPTYHKKYPKKVLPSEVSVLPKSLPYLLHQSSFSFNFPQQFLPLGDVLHQRCGHFHGILQLPLEHESRTASAGTAAAPSHLQYSSSLVSGELCGTARPPQKAASCPGHTATASLCPL